MRLIMSGEALAVDSTSNRGEKKRDAAVGGGDHFKCLQEDCKSNVEFLYFFCLIN